MLASLEKPLAEALLITLSIFVLMLLVELLNVRLQGRLAALMRSRRWMSYLVTALFGVIPGCEGEFLTVTLYHHGSISFGALVTCMIATTGDEGLNIVRMLPRAGLLLFALMAVLGVAIGWGVDRFRPRAVSADEAHCETFPHHPGHESLRHFLREHVIGHVLKQHLPRIFLWTAAALIVASWVEPYLVGGNGHAAVSSATLLLIGAVVGLIPSSGPHLLFVTLFAKGLAPFSVLAANSLSQTGHAALPLLHTSWRDVLKIKLITFVTGILVGLALWLLGW